MSRCQQCGARLLPLMKVCDYCGTQRPAGAPSADPVAAAFQVLTRSPEFAQARAAGPREQPPVSRGERPPLVILFVMLVTGLVIFRDVEGGMSFRTLVPIAFLAIPLAGLLRRKGRQRDYTRQEIQAVAARVQVADPWDHPSPRSVPLVHLELEDGERRRLRLPRELPVQLGEGDYGVAFLKGNLLVDFRRLRVEP